MNSPNVTRTFALNFQYHNTQTCVHTQRGGGAVYVYVCVCVWGNISLALWVQKQSLLASHIWSRSLPRFVGGSGESSANVCCSLFAHVIEVVSNRQIDRLRGRQTDRQTERQTQLAQHRSLAIDMETAVVAPSPSPSPSMLNPETTYCLSA